MQSVLNSAPDGYTIAFVGPNYAINPTLYDKLPFNFIRDSAPVGRATPSVTPNWSPWSVNCAGAGQRVVSDHCARFLLNLRSATS
jgi:hypothetical protein